MTPRTRKRSFISQPAAPLSRRDSLKAGAAGFAALPSLCEHSPEKSKIEEGFLPAL